MELGLFVEENARELNLREGMQDCAIFVYRYERSLCFCGGRDGCLSVKRRRRCDGVRQAVGEVRG